MKKRVLSLFLALTLCLTLTPTGALAEESLPGQTVVGCNAGDGNPDTCAAKRGIDRPCGKRRG